ncbi:unnamed protein product [Owenia fusiformis]|uniref:KATNIP domain-containing protein n=1 Tax=Owenia fusiformis TaxID=6347 RepID=A0A8J1U7C9_OWEFU|nr:unnamed protein product [Owenia fusiformis]
MDRGRKKWGKADVNLKIPPDDIQSKLSQKEVDKNYEEYLLLLQQRNKLVKKLKQKSQQEIELEQKEHGFSLYVNGSYGNSGPTAPKHKSPKQAASGGGGAGGGKLRKTKTAGDAPRAKQIITEEELLKAEEKFKELEAAKRARTAPAPRKNWLAGSIDIKTRKGEKVKVKAPSKVTGNYSEDFEEYTSENFEEHNSESETDDDQSELMRHMTMVLEKETETESSESDIEIDAGRHRLNTVQEEDEETNEQLLLSIQDVKKLRQSLEMNASIKQSIAEEISTDDSGSDIHDDDDIFEEEDIIEEVIEEQIEPSPPRAKHSSFLDPGETLVLEFGPTNPGKKQERDLSAARRPDAEEISQVRKSKSSPKHYVPKPKTSIDLKPTTPVRKSRPLSAAQRKSRESENVLDSTADTSAVLAALKAENDQVEKMAKQSAVTNRDEEDHRRSTEPGSALFDSQSEDVVPRESPTNLLSDENLLKVVDKVTKMDSKDQKKLFKALVKIEKTVSKPGTPRTPRAPSDNDRTPRNNDRTPRNEDRTPRNDNRTPRNKDRTARDSDLTPRVSQEDPDKTPRYSSVTPRNLECPPLIELHIELLSNWGHKSRIGLTEIQIFDMEKRRIPINESDLVLHGVKQPKGDLNNLFNGKFKSTKERNMWSCSFTPGEPVEFVFTLKNPDVEENFGLSKIKLWNFNKSLTELTVGVKDIRVFLGGELLYEGQIERGCGNQVFDYSTTININDALTPTPRGNLGNISHPNSTTPSSEGSTPSTVHIDTHSDDITTSIDESSVQSKMADLDNDLAMLAETSKIEGPTRSETRILRHSTDATLELPVVESPRDKTKGISSPIQPTNSPRQSTSLRHSSDKGTKKSQTPRSSKRMAAKLGPNQQPEEAKQSTKIVTDTSGNTTQSTENVTRSSQEDLPMLQQIREMTRKSSQGKPKWLSEEKKKTSKDKPKNKPSWLKSTDMENEPFEVPPESRSGRESSPSNPTQSRAETASRQKDFKTLLDDESHLESAVPKYMQSETGQGHLSDDEDRKWRNRRMSDDSEIEEAESQMKRIENSRNKWRKEEELKLEESWSSLNLFNKSQRGRICLDMQGDVMDEYLEKRRATPIQEEKDATINEPEAEECVIPELPTGRELVINILTTWGDRHYVGLNGIDIFSKSGEPISVQSISADPADINILPGYSQDPRVVTNLIDGVNKTRDDFHMWLAPYTAGSNHIIHITFEKPCSIALLRIWNYNKSRIHSYRGAKTVEMCLDGHYIFKGEIARACGGVMGGTEAFGDTILFTTDEEILENVSRYDDAYESEAFSDDDWEDDVPFERPRTADEELQERPVTRATRQLPNQPSETPIQKLDTVDMETVPSFTNNATYNEDGVYEGKCIQLNFTATWGDPYYLGLTGLELAGVNGEPIPLNMDMLDADPRDLRMLDGHQLDDRTLDKLVNNINITMSDENMWMVPYTEGEPHTVTINLRETTVLTGIRFWNYNKSKECTYRGAKLVHIKLDGQLISPPDGFLLRKAPGNCHFDFAQEVLFNQSSMLKYAEIRPREITLGCGDISNDINADYESVQMPRGFIYQLHLLSTWGDPYYVGLNGIEIYDANGRKIQLTDNNIACYPDSVNVLEGVQHDCRTPDKLIDDVNDTTDGRHMWLAPVLPNMVNSVFVIFDQPVTVSMIKLWNYSKTSQRGVKDFALLVDDLLVYNGQLEACVPIARGILPTLDLPQKYHTILFTQDKELLRKEKHTVISNQVGGQDVQLTDEQTIVGHYSNPNQAEKLVNQALRPTTSVPGQKRKAIVY